jgi:NADPH:quinone reductase
LGLYKTKNMKKINDNSTSGVIKMYSQGGSEVLVYEEEVVGNPAANQILLKHEAIGVNFVDIMFRNGTFPVTKFPTGAGVEASGIIEAVGKDITNFKTGDRVAYHHAMGAYAGRRLVSADNLVHLPDEISYETAAALHAKGLTANVLLNIVYKVKKGDILLVHAAAGGVGSLLSKWAKSLGATVISTVGSEEKKKQLVGLDGVIALDTENVVERVLQITGGQKIDVLYDGVGAATFGRSVELIKPGGTAILFGYASGFPKVDQNILIQNQIRFVSPDIGRYIQSHQHLEDLSAEVYKQYLRGTFGEINPNRFPLAEAAEVHRKLENRKTTGATILIP